MRGRVRDGIVATLWALLPVAAAVVLHRLGRVPWLQVDWADPAGWLDRTPLTDAIVAGLRLVGLVGAWWLALSTVAYLAARASGLRPLISVTGLLTLPAVRRVADRVVAGSVALSTLAAPMVATSLDDRPPPAEQVASDYLPTEVIPLPPPGTHAEEAEPPPRPSPGPTVELPVPEVEPAPPPEPEVEPTPPRPEGEPPAEPTISVRLDATLEVVVRPGDHLWALSERRLTEALGRPAADHEVAPYWLEVIEANRDRIRSGDPDLIYPGEVVVLPAVRSPEGS